MKSRDGYLILAIAFCVTSVGLVFGLWEPKDPQRTLLAGMAFMCGLLAMILVKLEPKP